MVNSEERVGVWSDGSRIGLSRLLCLYMCFCVSGNLGLYIFISPRIVTPFPRCTARLVMMMMTPAIVASYVEEEEEEEIIDRVEQQQQQWGRVTGVCVGRRVI